MLAFFASSGLLSARVVFLLLTVLLVLFLAAEGARVRRARPGAWLLDPPVVASVLTFGLPFVLGNALFFMPADALGRVGLIPGVTPAMVKLMWLVLLAAIGMWVGYRLPIANRIATPGVQREIGRWFSRSDKPRKLALGVLVGIGVVSRLIQIKLGLFGYSSSYDRLIAAGAFTQYLSLAAQLGTLALIVASLDHFSAERPNAALRLKFLLILLLEALFGVISGFKSQIVMPFIVVGACKYLCTRSFPKVWLAWFLAALVMAYAIVQPFRAARNTIGSFEGTSVAEIVGVLLGSTDERVTSDDAAPLWMSFVARSSLSHIGSLGVEYRDSVENLPDGSPRFLANIALSPAYAFIPRLIWRNKPSGDIGLWYTQVVMGLDSYSSTAMGPTTYLYLAGGTIAVFVGFVGFGSLQKILLLLVRPREGNARNFVFLALLPGITNIGSSIDGTIVSILRAVPLLMLVQYFVYRRTRAKNDVTWRLKTVASR